MKARRLGLTAFIACFLIGITVALLTMTKTPTSLAKPEQPTTSLTWTTRTPMPTAREFMVFVTANNGKLYAIGGEDRYANALAMVEEYNPTSNSWITKTSMPTARWGIGAALANNGKIYVIGGAPSTGGVHLTKVEEYDPSTDTWATKANMPTARQHLAVAASGGKIYAIGGYASTGITNKVEEYDPVLNTWRTRASIPTPRWALSAVTAADGKIYAIGGNVGGSTDVATVEMYDPTTDTWTPRASMSTARWSPGVVAASDGKIYAMNGIISGACIATVEAYDPSTNTWQPTTSMPTARCDTAAAAVNDKFYVVGGGSTPNYGTPMLNVLEEASGVGGPLLTVSPASIPADGVTVSTITLGNAPMGHRVRFISSRGPLDTFSAMSGIVNTTGQLTTTVRSSTAGVAIITAQDLNTGRVFGTSTRMTFTGSGVILPPSIGPIDIVQVNSDLPLNGIYPHLNANAASANQFGNVINVMVDWHNNVPGRVEFVLNDQTIVVPASANGARTTLNMATQARSGENTLRITAYDSAGDASLPKSYSFSNYIVGGWLLPAFEGESSSFSQNSGEPALTSALNMVRPPKACAAPTNDDDTDQSFGVEINQANNGAPQIEASLRVPPAPLRSVVDLGLSGGTGLEKLQFYALVAMPLDGSNRYTVTGGFDVTTRTCDRRRVSPKLILWGIGPTGEGPIKGTKPWLNIKASAELGASGQLYPVFTLDELDANAKVKLELEWQKSVLVLLKIHPALGTIYDAISAVPGLETWLADHAAIILTLGPSFEISGAFSPEATGLTLQRAEAGMGFDIQGRLEVHTIVDLTTYAGIGGNARLRYTAALRQLAIAYARLYGEIGYRLTGPFGLNQGGHKIVEWVYDTNQLKWMPLGTSLPEAEGQWQWPEHISGKDYAVFYGINPQASFAVRRFSQQTVGIAAQATVTSILISNVYTYLAPSLAVNPVTDEAVLLWVHDVITKPVGQSQEIAFSRWNGSAWSTPSQVTDDNQLDGAPQVAWAGNGSAVAVWERLNDILPISATWDVTTARKIEIATAVFSPTTGLWTNVALLTINTALDFKPEIARNASGNLLAVWRQNEAGLVGGTVTQTDRIAYAFYSASSWGTSTTAVDNLPGLVDLAAGNGNNAATIAYTQYFTPTGYPTPTLQLFTSTWNGSTWAAPIQRTDDSLGHRNPRVVYNALNQPLVVWLAGNELRLQNLSTSSTITLTLENGLAIDEFRVVQDANGNIIAVMTVQTAQRDLYVASYDQVHNVWGKPLSLTDDRASETYPTAGLDSGGRLLMAYASTAGTSVTKTTTISGTGEIVTYTIPTEGNTDLMTLAHEFTSTVRLTNLAVSNDHPTPGDVVTLTVTLENSGDFAVNGPTVSFYDGNPAAAGTLIGNATLPRPFAGGFTTTLTTSYTIPLAGAARALYAALDATNVVSLTAFGPDLEIGSGSIDYWGGSQVGLRTVIRNIGTTDAPTSTLVFYSDAVTGTVITTDTVPGLSVGQTMTLTTPWDFGALDSGSYPIAAVVNQHDFTETFTANNLYTMALQTLPDLAVSPYYLWTTSPTGAHVVITATIFNFGAYTATNSVIGLYGSDQLVAGPVLFTRTITSLGPGQATTISGQVAGSLQCTAYVYADPQQLQSEIDRSNNLAGIGYRGRCYSIYLPIVLRN
jgi:uncharacterized repeat protein (TIGR01451 family)